MQISIVIPVFNGEKSLMELNKRLIQTLSKQFQEFEIIYVDDDSNDKSKSVIKELCTENDVVKYVFLKSNSGQQAAIFAGMQKSKGDILVTIDDDLQHPPEDIIQIVSDLDGYDGIFAFPYEKPHKRYRKLGSFMTNKLFKILFKKADDLKISSFRAIKRPLVNKMLATNQSFVYISALMIKNSWNLKTIYSRQFHRKYGQSNYSFRKLLMLYLNIIIYYSDNGLMRRMQKKTELYQVLEES